MALHTIVEHDTEHIKPYVDAKISSVKQALSDEVETRAKLGAHNIYDVYGEKYVSGATYTYANNGLRVQSASEGAFHYMKSRFTLDENTDYKLSTNVTITSGDSLIVLKGHNSSGDTTIVQSVSPTGATELSFNSGSGYEYYELLFYCTRTAATGNVLYADIMIRDAKDAYTGYTPYAPTNSQLLSYKDNGVLGSKNLLPNNLTTQVIGNLTYTVNSDGTVSLNGTTNADHFAYLVELKKFLPVGSYIVSTGVSDAALQGDSIIVDAYNNGTWVKTIGRSYGAEVRFNVDYNGYNQISVAYRVYSGHTYNNLKTYPMIRLASDSDPTYQPFAMTNQQLTTDKAEKSDLASINITGTTNTTGATIAIRTYFYLNGQLVKAKADIAANAAFTLNTNYEVVTAGALNTKIGTFTPESGVTSDFSVKQVGNIVTINGYASVPITHSDGVNFNSAGAISGVDLPKTSIGAPRVLCGIAVKPWEIPLEVGYATIESTTGKIFFKTTQTGTKSIYLNITYAV